jgi:stearoyl-CoA desaturase (delta-9 desaturase)
MNTGLFDMPLWGVVLYTLAVTHLTIVSVTIYLHRHQAHRALDLHPAASHLFRFWLWLTTGMVTREWVAVHRKHHARCEGPEDPHSPQQVGLMRVLWGGAVLYRREACNCDTVERYGRGAPEDWLERRLYGRHDRAGLLLMLGIDLFLLGGAGAVVWAIQMIWIPLWAAGVVNGLGHYLGYRNWETPDASTNLLPWGVLIGGEELHNNHHAYPGSARLSARAWEVDVGWLYIRLLAWLRMARVRKVAPRPARVVRRAEALSAEAVHAVAARRLQVLARYGREVMARVHRDELQRAARDRGYRRLLRRARALVMRDRMPLDEEARCRLAKVLASSEALRTAYRYRERLHQVWREAGHGQERVLQALQMWCREAESSGIEALESFARRLAGYRLPRSA